MGSSWILILWVLLITNGYGVQAAKVNLKILTWNTGLLYIPLRELAGEQNQLLYENRTPDEYLPDIAQTIASQEPDFISLQEIRSVAQAETLTGLLGNRYSFIALNGNRDRYIVLYFRKSFQVLEEDKIVVPGQRELPLVKIKTHSNHAITVVGVHLSAFDISGRNRQTQAILDWLANSSGAVILAGDFNFDPRGSNYPRLTSAVRDLTENLQTSTIFSGKLDYVFLRAERSDVRSQAYLLPRSRWGLMDHFPIVVQMELGLRRLPVKNRNRN